MSMKKAEQTMSIDALCKILVEIVKSLLGGLAADLYDVTTYLRHLLNTKSESSLSCLYMYMSIELLLLGIKR